MRENTCQSLYLKRLALPKGILWGEGTDPNTALTSLHCPWHISRYAGRQQEATLVGALGWEPEGISTFPTLPKLCLLLRFLHRHGSNLRMIILLCKNIRNLAFWTREGTGERVGDGKGEKKAVFVPFWLSAVWTPANSPCWTPPFSSYPGCGEIHRVLCDYSF